MRAWARLGRTAVGVVLSWSAASCSTHSESDLGTIEQPLPAFCDGVAYECIGLQLQPWQHIPIACNGSPTDRGSEGAASAAVKSADYPSTTFCNVQFVRKGWITSSRASNSFSPGNCSGVLPPSFPVISKWGDEMDNRSLYDVTYGIKSGTSCINVQTTADQAVVKRQRLYTCPVGYGTDTTNGVCYRAVGTPDPGKNQGNSCPLVADPVNPANGNSFQSETDYQGAGAYPLTLTRYYNSSGAVSAYLPSFGEGWKTSLGPYWRHNFDRRIIFIKSGAPTATAYRADGKFYAFRQNGTAFATSADIRDRLEATRDTNGEPIAWQYTADGGDVETYDALGRLKTMKNKDGIVLTLAYDASGNLSTVTDSFGRKLTFVYDTAGKLKSVKDPAGATVSYAYDATTGVLNRATYPDTTIRRYLYEDTARPYSLTGILDENGKRFATWAYDTNNRVTQAFNGAGALSYSLTYNPDKTTTVVDPMGVSRTYVFSVVQGAFKNTAVNQPCSTCGGANASQGTAYDAQGNVISRTDFDGNVTCYANDAVRNVEIVRAEGLRGACPTNLAAWVPQAGTSQRKVTTEWHPTLKTRARVAEAGRITSYEYDTHGHITKITEQGTLDPRGGQGFAATVDGAPRIRTWTLTHSTTLPSFVERSEERGNRSDVQELMVRTYYAPNATCTPSSAGSTIGCRGQLKSVTNALGQHTDFTVYNAHGLSESLVDANGVVTSLTYDARGRLKSKTIAGETTTYQYDAAGLLRTVTFPNGAALTYDYDDAHRLTAVKDSLQHQVVFELDNLGNVKSTQYKDELGVLRRLVSREFDALGRLSRQIGATDPTLQMTEYRYTGGGQIQTITLPKPVATATAPTATLEYDTLTRLARMTGPLGAVSVTGFGANDRLETYTDPRGEVTSLSHDGLRNPRQTSSRDKGQISAVPDVAGHVVSTIDGRGTPTSFVHDELGRIKTALLADGQSMTWTYDDTVNGGYALGRLTRVTYPGGSSRFVYDAAGRVTSRIEDHTTPAASFAVQYQYAGGMLSQSQYPSGRKIDIVRNAAGRITGLKVDGVAVLTGATYVPFGAVQSWTWGNGSTMTRGIDLDGRLTSIPISATLSRSVAYDGNSRPTKVWDPAAPTTGVQTYSFDDANRLTRWQNGTAVTTYEYDANGNRTRVVRGAAVETYGTETAPISNRLLTLTKGTAVQTFAYDGAGNITGDGMQQWHYDARGRLDQFQKGATTVTYAYDAFGQRITKRGPTSVVTTGAMHFVYDDDGHLLGEYSATGAPLREYVYFDHIPVAVLTGTAAATSIFYVFTDIVGRPWTVMDTSNRLRWRWDTEPFGMTTPNQNPAGLGTFTMPLRFPGQYFDTESGLFSNYFRDYDPKTGRYIEGDPAGLLGDSNPYAYANGNPLTQADPLGLRTLYYAPIVRVPTPPVNYTQAPVYRAMREAFATPKAPGSPSPQNPARTIQPVRQPPPPSAPTIEWEAEAYPDNPEAPDGFNMPLIPSKRLTKRFHYQGFTTHDSGHLGELTCLEQVCGNACQKDQAPPAPSMRSTPLRGRGYLTAPTVAEVEASGECRCTRAGPPPREPEWWE